MVKKFSNKRQRRLRKTINRLTYLFKDLRRDYPTLNR